MVDAREIREHGGTPGSKQPTQAEELEQKQSELVEFRDAGVLTETEFEEQKAKLRWGIP
jgi:hypothetical protein